MKKLVVLIIVALGLVLLAPASASASTPTLKSLAKSVVSLQKQVKSLKAKVAAQATTISSLQSNPALTLSWLPTYLSLDTNAENGVAGPNITFAGCNVHVRSASGETDGSGLGNLIVGWDESPTTPQRGGENNLVCGDFNNFSNYGCFVAGSYNTVSGIFASVNGGQWNMASGDLWASVGGGLNNTAGGTWTTVGGGYNNDAESQGATISGGDSITLDSVTVNAWQGGAYHTP